VTEGGPTAGPDAAAKVDTAGLFGARPTQQKKQSRQALGVYRPVFFKIVPSRRSFFPRFYVSH